MSRGEWTMRPAYSSANQGPVYASDAAMGAGPFGDDRRAAREAWRAQKDAWREERRAWKREHGCGSGRMRYFRTWELVAMILGFVFFFPVGLAILAYVVGRNKGWWGDHGVDNWRDARTYARDHFERHETAHATTHVSGNAAFDDYRAKEIERLEEERRRLDEEAAQFRTFVEQLKRAKDQEEFDRFMNDRRGRRPDAPSDGPTSA